MLVWDVYTNKGDIMDKHIFCLHNWLGNNDFLDEFHKIPEQYNDLHKRLKKSLQGNVEIDYFFARFIFVSMNKMVMEREHNKESVLDLSPKKRSSSNNILKKVAEIQRESDEFDRKVDKEKAKRITVDPNDRLYKQRKKERGKKKD